MNTQKHTQGPWSVAFYGETERPVIKHGDQSIADVRGCELDDSTSHSLANARLIAAAPELLAAAEALVEFADGNNRLNLTGKLAESVGLARAAIAKSEGVK